MDNEVIFSNTMLVMLSIALMSITPNTRPTRVVDVPRFEWSIPLGVFAVWILASCPIILGSWTDRGAYASGFLYYQQHSFSWSDITSSGEWFFQLYTSLCSLFTNYIVWFYITAILYVGNYLIASRRLTGEYAYVLFISILCNFQFYSYGENTLRAGFAASLVTLGLTFCNKMWIMLLCFVLAHGIHNSMLIPIFALLVAYKIPKNKLFIWGWLGAIAVSLVVGSFFEQYLAGYADERRAGYFDANAVAQARYRWDFLAYSAAPVLLGYYYIFKLNLKSIFYQWIYRAYLIANSCWILVIRVAYTDRFAYLSWFLFPILLLYPLLTHQLFRDVSVQRRYIVVTLICQFAFCYYMYLAYHGFKPW